MKKRRFGSLVVVGLVLTHSMFAFAQERNSFYNIVSRFGRATAIYCEFSGHKLIHMRTPQLTPQQSSTLQSSERVTSVRSERRTSLIYTDDYSYFKTYDQPVSPVELELEDALTTRLDNTSQLQNVMGQTLVLSRQSSLLQPTDQCQADSEAVGYATLPQVFDVFRLATAENITACSRTLAKSGAGVPYSEYHLAIDVSELVNAVARGSIYLKNRRGQFVEREVVCRAQSENWLHASMKNHWLQQLVRSQEYAALIADLGIILSGLEQDLVRMNGIRDSLAQPFATPVQVPESVYATSEIFRTERVAWAKQNMAERLQRWISDFR
jgi:hypothetical protein